MTPMSAGNLWSTLPLRGADVEAISQHRGIAELLDVQRETHSRTLNRLGPKRNSPPGTT